MTIAARTFSAAVVTALACVAILVTLVAHYANHVLLSSESFSGRAVSLVNSATVDAIVVDTIAGRVSAAVGNDPSLRPAINRAVSQALSDPQITADIRGTANSLQAALVSGNANTLVLTLPAAGPAIAARVQSASPQLAAEIRAIGTVRVLDVPIPSSAASAVHAIVSLGQDEALLIVLAAALVALALLLAPNRRRALIWLGAGTCAVGLLAAAAYLVGRGVVVGQFSSVDAQAAARSAWSIYMGGIETWGFGLAAAGAVVASIAALG